MKLPKKKRLEEKEMIIEKTIIKEANEENRKRRLLAYRLRLERLAQERVKETGHDERP